MTRVALIDTRAWGVLRAAHRGLRRAVGEQIDRAFGVQTAWLEPQGEAAGDDHPEIAIKPCAWLTLWRAFHWLRLRPDDVVIDLGSGPGRAVLVAATFRLRRVIGVERELMLHEQARANLLTSRLPRRTARIDLVCSDVLDYRLPDDVTVVFMYNPFRGTVFRRTVAEILRSVDARPRRLRLVYVNPQEHDVLIGTGRFRLVATLMDKLRPGRDWARMLAAYVYEVTPGSAAGPATVGDAPSALPPSSAS